MLVGTREEKLADPIDVLQLSFYRSAMPWERWLINHRRRKEGKLPFGPGD